MVDQRVCSCTMLPQSKFNLIFVEKSNPTNYPTRK